MKRNQHPAQRIASRRSRSSRPGRRWLLLAAVACGSATWSNWGQADNLSRPAPEATRIRAVSPFQFPFGPHSLQLSASPSSKLSLSDEPAVPAPATRRVTSEDAATPTKPVLDHWPVLDSPSTAKNASAAGEKATKAPVTTKPDPALLDRAATFGEAIRERFSSALKSETSGKSGEELQPVSGWPALESIEPPGRPAMAIPQSPLPVAPLAKPDLPSEPAQTRASAAVKPPLPTKEPPGANGPSVVKEATPITEPVAAKPTPAATPRLEAPKGDREQTKTAGVTGWPEFPTVRPATQSPTPVQEPREPVAPQAKVTLESTPSVAPARSNSSTTARTAPTSPATAPQLTTSRPPATPPAAPELLRDAGSRSNVSSPSASSAEPQSGGKQTVSELATKAAQPPLTAAKGILTPPSQTASPVAPATAKATSTPTNSAPTAAAVPPAAATSPQSVASQPVAPTPVKNPEASKVAAATVPAPAAKPVAAVAPLAEAVAKKETRPAAAAPVPSPASAPTTAAPAGASTAIASARPETAATGSRTSSTTSSNVVTSKPALPAAQAPPFVFPPARSATTATTSQPTQTLPTTTTATAIATLPRGPVTAKTAPAAPQLTHPVGGPTAKAAASVPDAVSAKRAAPATRVADERTGVAAAAPTTALELPWDGSRRIRTRTEITEVIVEDPRVCDVVRLNSRELVVFAKSAGVTAVSLSGGPGRSREVHLVRVLRQGTTESPRDDSLAALQSAIARRFPDCQVRITGQADLIEVAGIASSKQQAIQIVALVRDTFLVPVSDRLEISRTGSAGRR